MEQKKVSYRGRYDRLLRYTDRLAGCTTKGPRLNLRWEKDTLLKLLRIEASELIKAVEEGELGREYASKIEQINSRLLTLPVWGGVEI